jgi:hypothetical protein
MTITKDEDYCIDLTKSFTVDNAVRLLLGVSSSTLNDTTEKEWADADSLENLLSCIVEDALTDYNNAIFDKKPTQVIAAKFESLNKAKLLLVNARDYLTKIDDEFFVNTDEVRNKHINLNRLKRWAKETLNISILEDLDFIKATKPLPKMRQQENAIIDAIKKLGHDPQKLPKKLAGKPGVKSKVRELIQHPPLFDNSRIFDKAWERLSKYKEIIILK